MMHPVGIEVVVQLQHDVVRGRDVFELAHHAMAAVGDRLGQQPALLLQLDVVGAFGGGKHRHHDADDRDEDDDADRRGAECARARPSSCACGTAQAASKPLATRASPQGLTLVEPRDLSGQSL